MTQSPASNQLVLVDGSGYIFRAFHGLPMMNRPDGTPINAVFGFTKMLLKLKADLNPTHIIVIFDAGRVTFRNEIIQNIRPTDPSRRRAGTAIPSGTRSCRGHWPACSGNSGV